MPDTLRCLYRSIMPLASCVFMVPSISEILHENVSFPLSSICSHFSSFLFNHIQCPQEQEGSETSRRFLGSSKRWSRGNARSRQLLCTLVSIQHCLQHLQQTIAQCLGVSMDRGNDSNGNGNLVLWSTLVTRPSKGAKVEQG